MHRVHVQRWALGLVFAEGDHPLQMNPIAESLIARGALRDLHAAVRGARTCRSRRSCARRNEGRQ